MIETGGESQVAPIPFGCEELGRLQSVLVHTPGEELGLVNESNFRQWQFDFVPDRSRFIEEHLRYLELLGSHGVRVHQLTSFLDGRAKMARTLPNLMYLHDTAVITSKGAVVSQMVWSRCGEEVVVKEALANMGIPIFIDLQGKDDAFEGCLLLSPKTILVANTERHNKSTIEKFIRRALEEFDEVIFADIPKARRFMHPDTIYNRITDRLALAYLPAFQETYIHRRRSVEKIDLVDFMRARGVEIIPVSDSEQQRLACSFVPLDSGVMMHYDTALDAETQRELCRRNVELVLFHPAALVAGGGSLRCITLRLHRRKGPQPKDEVVKPGIQ
jgi:arginine deiminase